MTARCTICTHPEVATIDAELVAGGTNRDIAGRFGLSKSAVDRHRGEHLPALLALARDTAEVDRAGALLARLDALEATARAALDEAIAAGVDRDRDARGWFRELRQTIELLARVNGDLRDEVSVSVTAEFHGLAVLVLDALRPHPDARLAVVQALRDVTDVA